MNYHAQRHDYVERGYDGAVPSPPAGVNDAPADLAEGSGIGGWPAAAVALPEDAQALAEASAFSELELGFFRDGDALEREGAVDFSDLDVGYHRWRGLWARLFGRHPAQPAARRPGPKDEAFLALTRAAPQAEAAVAPAPAAGLASVRGPANAATKQQPRAKRGSPRRKRRTQR
jgi:hypothetical protein